MWSELLLVGFSAVFLFAIGAVLAAVASSLGLGDETLYRWINVVGSIFEKVGSI